MYLMGKWGVGKCIHPGWVQKSVLRDDVDEPLILTLTQDGVSIILVGIATPHFNFQHIEDL